MGALPHDWAADALRVWAREHQADRTAGNLQHLRTVRDLNGVMARRIGLDASDSDLCAAAAELAGECMAYASTYHDASNLRAAMERKCLANGVKPPAQCGMTDAGAIARMSCELWWRRRLRAAHGRAVEAAAIKLGRVSKRREVYASEQTCKRRARQVERNTATLESTTATNEHGQEFTLAELAARGPSDKAIRRAELMTRIAGFERIAGSMGHAAMMVTITCPSRMHRMRTAGRRGAVVVNGRYDGTTPREASQYLGKSWARMRAKLNRLEISLYGFRIAEPQHDGTPHWHMLVFCEPGQVQDVKNVVRHYALQDSGAERGAAAHRCDFVQIDTARGTAAGYIAKYVAKNIDGYKVEKDLFGNDCITASARVEAWATTWGIRQFQQVGGPPVGPWRELRRIEEMPEGAPAEMVEAWQAVNKMQVMDGREQASVSWEKYVRAQGGVYCGRRYRVRVSMAERDTLTRYGEQSGPVPIGVEAAQRIIFKPPHMAHMPDGCGMERTVLWIVESKRCVWTINRRRRVAACSAHRAPWTRVNNCTGQAAGQKNTETQQDQSEWPLKRRGFEHETNAVKT